MSQSFSGHVCGGTREDAWKLTLIWTPPDDSPTRREIPQESADDRATRGGNPVVRFGGCRDADCDAHGYANRYANGYADRDAHGYADRDAYGNARRWSDGLLGDGLGGQQR